MKIYLVQSTFLSRPVYIADAEVAKQFADAQEADTGYAHVIEPIEVYEDATALHARIDDAHRASALAKLAPGEIRALGLTKPVPVKPNAESAKQPAEDA